MEGLARTTGVSCGRQGVLAEVSKRVVTALEEFARERPAGPVAADPLGGSQVVVAVGAAGMSRLLRGLVQRPAQRGWPLTREPSGRAVPVGLLDRDVQARVADRVARVVEAAGVTELCEGRHPRPPADAGVRGDQR